VNNSFITNLFSLHNKVAVITGGTGVLGVEMVNALASAGAKVIIVARNIEKAKQTVEGLRKETAGEITLVEADVTELASVEKAYESILKSYEAVDILINAAGGNRVGAVIQPDQHFSQLSINDYQQVLNLNLNGSVLPAKVFCQDWMKSKSGVMVNISSMAATRTITRVLGYSLAKAAIDNFTKWLAVEMAQKYGDGIRVNAIAPGFFITEQNRRLLTHEDGSLTPRGEKVIQQTPMKRFGTPNELIGTLLWLCSDASKFVTGAAIPVDGGFSAYSGV